MIALIDIYDLETLSEIEGVTYSNLRTIIRRLKKSGSPLEWRGYKFFGHPSKSLFAYRDGSEITVHMKVKDAG